MPFLDRIWWLRIAGGVALIVAALALASAWTNYARSHPSAASSPWPGATFMLLLPLLALAIALWWGYGALAERKKELTRRQALAGDLNALPMATFSGNPSLAPDLDAGPLVIMWRPHHAIQRAVLLIAALILLLDGVIIYGVSQIMGVRLPIPIDFASFWLRLALISAILLLFTLHLAIILAAPYALRLRTGATFTSEGVHETTRWGRRRFLRWEDARLFEVEAIQTLNRRYTLYGARSAVSWRDEIPAYDSEAIQQRDHENYVPDGVSVAEMSRRLRAALHLVAAYTNLQPRTLSATLQGTARPQAAPTALFGVRLRSAGPLSNALFTGLTLPLFFLPAALGVAFIYWRPASSSMVNIVSALALVAASEILLVALALSLNGAASTRSTTLESAIAGAAPPALSENVNYAMPLPGSYLSRRWSVALGLLLLIGGIPGIILLCLLAAEYITVLFFPARVTALIASFPHTPGAFTVAGLSFCAGVVGLALSYFALSTEIPWRKQVQANAEGLRIENGSITRSLPWDAIETLTLVCVGPVPTTYRITGDTGKVSLNWPAQADTLLGSATPKGALLLAPNGLAALIEQQPGVRRRIQVIGLPEPPHSLPLPAPTKRQGELAEPSPPHLHSETAL